MKQRRLSTALLLSLLFPLFSAPGWAQRADYTGHRVITVHLRTQAELDRLLAIGPDVWSESIGVGPLDVRVNPRQLARIRRQGFSYDLKIGNVQALIDRERGADSVPLRDPFAKYMDLGTAHRHLDKLAASHPGIARVITVGASLEGRPIRGLVITGGAGDGTLPGILFQGCQHAREWISVMVPLYIATQLVQRYGSDPAITRLVDNTEIYVVPIVNPDGYVHTWTYNRLWRKNRRGGYGVDLNRNWDVMWESGIGTSTSPASDVYRGPAPFSEPEAQALRDFVLARPNLRGFLDYHSYGQLVMWPWGYTPRLTPDDPVFREVGLSMRGAIAAVSGVSYTAGPKYTTIYPVSGGVTDWVYDRQGIWSFTIELRDTGRFGFLLPSNQIRPTCEENFPAAFLLADWIRTRSALPEGWGEFGSALTGIAVSARP